MQQKRNNSPRIDAHDIPADVMWPRIAVVFSVAVLVVIGLVMVYSASAIVNIDAELGAAADAVRQLFYAAVGIVLCLLIARFLPIHVLRGNLTWLIFIGTLLILIATAAIGTEELGAQRWITIAGFSFQPSEFAKIGVLLLAAKLVVDYLEGMMSTRRFLVFFGVLNIIIVGLITVAQSDLGTTIICFMGMVAILWLAEVDWRILGGYVAGIVAVGVVGLSHGYRLERLLSFTHPWDDYYGSGYQIIHSMYAFAQGGVFGTGLGNSAEKYLYLPEAHTDFIFAIIGEELGFLGAVLVIAMFIVFLVGGLRMAQMAPDGFSAILCGSFTIIIVFQAFLNIGCVIGVMPITGKPLPFVSAGGSSLIASLIMVGVMLAVSRSSGETSEYQRRRADIRPVDWGEYGYDPRPSRGGGRASYDPRAGRRGLPASAGYGARASQRGLSASIGRRPRPSSVNLASGRGYSASISYQYSRGRGR